MSAVAEAQAVGRPGTLRIRRALGYAVLYAILVVFSIFMLVPFVFALLGSLKPEPEVFAVPIRWLPLPFQPENYARAWAMANWSLYFFNSFLVAAATTLLNVFFASLAGYGFAKYRFPFRQALFVLVLSTLMIPFQVIMVPLFIITRDLGWLNTYQGLIVPGAVTAFGVFMMRQFMITIPDELM